MINNSNKFKKRMVLMSFAVIFFIIIFFVVGTVILKYEVEGETNMPFKINKIMVISSCEGVSKDNKDYLWDLNIMQNNDVYISIAKNKNKDDLDILDNVTFENFVISNKNDKGKVVIYRPSKDSNRVYEHLDEYKVNDNVVYNGSSATNLKNLEVANQGGFLLVRFSTENLDEYLGNDDEIKQNASLLDKGNITDEDLKYNVSFDVVITLKSGVKYKTTVNLEMPAASLREDGTSSYEFNDLSEVVFKRV